ncbi:MAG TPA: S24 family peptidase [Candidatus Dojkabacteria bacterium]|nr:S24 family peptidase [Candidatus Dojkabacteria bacterium]
MTGKKQEPKAHNKIVGFPSPAEDFAERDLDLNEFLIRHQAATFFLRVHGDGLISLAGPGAGDGAILVVDRSLNPANDCLVVAILDGEFVAGRLRQIGKTLCLLRAGSGQPQPLPVNGDTDFSVWGVVTAIIKKLI